MDHCLSAAGLCKRYGDLAVLDRWQLTLAQGERLALLGPSGCGKTTFLRIVAGLEQPSGGTLQMNARRIGFVFQEPRLIPWRTVGDNLRFVRPEVDPAPLLHRLGLEGFAGYLPARLSGGMRQRVNLARALIVEPDLLILDEAFHSLDLPVKLGIIADLERLWQERRFTLLAVTHDPREALLLADRIALLSERPSHVAREVAVPLGPGRLLASPALALLEAELIAAMCAPPSAHPADTVR